MKDDELPEAKFFSPILTAEYIRLMTAAYYISNENKNASLKFAISKEYYQQMSDCLIQAPLIGLNLSYDESLQVLSVMADDYFLKMYENKIQQEVALNFSATNKNRYNKYIRQIL